MARLTPSSRAVEEMVLSGRVSMSQAWPRLGLQDQDDFTAAEAAAVTTRITDGNFRPTCRLIA